MKQINELKKDLTDIFDEEYYRRNLITPQNTAEKLAEKGYRKQTDIENCIPLDVHEALKRRAVEIAKAEVAREIFEEIERNLVTIADVDFNRFRCIGARAFAELKKKYTEGKDE